MKLLAIDARTGALLLSQHGTQDEGSFKKTALAMFPHKEEQDILIVCDGAMRGRAAAPAPRKAAASKRAIVWKGSFTDLGGYANMNREIVMRLASQHGYSVKIDVLKTGLQVDPMTGSLLKVLETTKIANEASSPLVVGFTPMSVQARGRKVIFYTMMESQSLHHEFVERCNKGASEIWVPCGFYERVFKKSGITRPIRVIRLGVNQNLYTPDAREPHLLYENLGTGQRGVSVPKDNTRIMSLFGWSYRKGADILCRSFLREFSAADRCCLVIYSRYMGSSADVHKDFVRKEIAGYYEAEKKDDPAHIYYCGDEIPIPDLPGCYAAADAFCFCSRGEGFGLPVIEAAACGVPVISAYNTAMTEYLDDDVAYTVRSTETAPANEQLTWISGYYRDQEFAVLGEPEIEQFGRHMRAVHEDAPQAAKKAAAFRERVVNEYTWDICAANVAKRLQELS